ncbi:MULTISPECIES: TonB-dependent receptor [Alteromonadaceae]|jgi:iron complex outermembrane receptor protein|uniref:TonB-dependent receptor n=1 Tax=Brumicola blandensis TaxID=3075611 RepID=A0AAW8QYN4_9ALTE|nr:MULTISPECIES: TonB-dependent receptor [unclassified Alteromonas]MDT0581889.1 TonB-dependent receptor [Alteromonas sp. W409]MDT0628434.1 TonB-dependent receptor [Alteromonas sp. W364]
MKLAKRTPQLALLAIAVSTALSAPQLAAQETEVKEEIRLERIQVTARKTSENLQEVPLAVTSIGAKELSEKGIAQITEIQQFSPNTTLQTSRGTNSTLTAFIRGVGQQDPLWGYEPGVGIYIDDVYIARPQGAVLDLLDVDRIEVLRGPQGTLYGKNTIGGAIKYVTKPMSGGTEFNAEATVGSYSQRDVKLTGQLPIVDDKVYVGFGFADLSRDGFGEYLQSALANQDRENYNKDLWAARVDLEFRPADDLFIKLNWDKTRDTSNAKGGYRLLPSLLTNAPVPDSVYDSYTSLPTSNLVELEGYSLMISYDYSDELELKYIASRREGYSPTNIDFDNTALDIFDVPAEYKDENSTHEIQANYSTDGYSLVSGIYLYDGESCGNFDAILGFLGRAAFGTPGLTREVTGCNNSESWAAYTQASFDISETLSMTVGARYTDEEKTAIVNNGLVFANVYPQSGWIPGYVRPDGQLVPTVLGDDANGDGVLDGPKSQSWSRFTPRLGLEYQAADNILLFASYSQGFKSGTFNPRATINEDGVNPEIVDSLEVGMKADWNDRLRTNVTLFSFDHKDRQYVGFGEGNSATDLQQVLRNVAETSATGLEAEVTYVATDNLTFDLALGYIDEKIEVNNAIPPLIGLSNTPETTVNLSANYFLETNVGGFVINAGYYYRGDYLLFETSDLLEQDAYGMFNVSVSWESNEGDWYASLHGKNLTDEEYLVGGYDFVGVGPNGELLPGLGGDTTLIGYYGDPRTVHLTVGYRF